MLLGVKRLSRIILTNCVSGNLKSDNMQGHWYKYQPSRRFGENLTRSWQTVTYCVNLSGMVSLYMVWLSMYPVVMAVIFSIS